jgi:hypothetical protein
MNKLNLIGPCLLLIAILNHTQHSIGQTLKGPNLGQDPPGTTPEKFAPGFISTAAHEFSCSFTPDGNEFYFTRKDPASGKNYIMVTNLQDETWSTPQKAGFINNNESFEAVSLADGRRIFFTMARPGFYDGLWSIWYVRKTGNSWSGPMDPGTLFNPMKTMFVSTDLNGNLYTTDISGGQGHERIMTSSPENGEYLRFSVLPDPVNRNAKDMYPFIFSDGKILIFNSSRNSQSDKSGLYVSHLADDGSWQEPFELDLGMKAGLAYLSGDGKYLFFTAGPALASDIYWVSAKVLEGGSSSAARVNQTTRLELGQNFPNPFGFSTQIPLNLDESGEVEVCLYSTSGRMIAPLFKQYLNPGYNLIPFMAGNIDNGIYLYEASFNGKRVNGKTLMIIK